METRKTIETEIEGLKFGYWDEYNQKIVSLETTNAIEKFMKRENWQKELLDSIVTLKCDLIEKLYKDLISIWNRLDRLEK